MSKGTDDNLSGGVRKSFDVKAVLARSAPKLLSLIFDDPSRPGVQKVGKALASTFEMDSTMLLPAKLSNDKVKENFQKHMNNYEQKLSSVEEDKVMDVPPEIGIPLLEKLTYTTNEDLADLFINILHKASSIDTVNLAHPSFVEIVKRLSVDEARILYYLKGKIEIPAVSLRVNFNNRPGFVTVRKNETGINRKINLDFPQNLGFYIDNLMSIGILSYATGLLKMDDNFYSDVISVLEKSKIELEGVEDIHSITYEKSFFEVTDFGLHFINACTKKL